MLNTYAIYTNVNQFLLLPHSKIFFSTSNNVINSIQFEIWNRICLVNPFFFLKQDAFNIELENLEAEGGLGE